MKKAIFLVLVLVLIFLGGMSFVVGEDEACVNYDFNCDNVIDDKDVKIMWDFVWIILPNYLNYGINETLLDELKNQCSIFENYANNYEPIIRVKGSIEWENVEAVFVVYNKTAECANVIPQDIPLQLCPSPGQVQSGKYCDVDGVWKELKANDATCLNNFECMGLSCVDRICQSKYAAIAERGNLIERIWMRIQGYECVPENDEEGIGWKCEGTKYFSCGAESTWEGGVEVIGKCGVSGDGNGGNGGSGDQINIIIYSPQNVTYSYKTISLKVGDSHGKARYWRYILNDGSKTDFTPNITISAVLGSNLLTVYARETQTSSTEKSRAVRFSVVDLGPDTYCGDGVCDFDEDCDICPSDCGQCEERCGNGVCDYDYGENSANCPEDCEPEERTDLTWLFWFLLVLVLIIIGFVAFVLVRKVRKNRMSGEIKPSPKPLTKPPSKPFEKPVNLIKPLSKPIMTSPVIDSITKPGVKRTTEPVIKKIPSVKKTPSRFIAKKTPIKKTTVIKRPLVKKPDITKKVTKTITTTKTMTPKSESKVVYRTGNYSPKK